ncbi:MAG: (2Fe-2S)-binding protein [Deltaproteobacteria bacterium]|nr:(2Fe-2S)-binding protein [Deltaproteobacteria bacterium]
MVKIKIDNQELEVAEGTTVLQAALDNKIDVPYFCWHSKLSIAGNCRMCLVNLKGSPKPVISCRERVREGLEVDTKSPEVKKMQQGVLEFILLNHPLDCPICDQSGECPLQDNYFKFSKFPSRIEDQKIHKPKAVPLGPLVTLDDERCIVCTRCVRFCDEVTGTHELCVTERGGHSTLRTYPGAELKNPYSLCTVDICPVGALTSTDFRFKKRVWFLKSADSICTGCATGCNIKMDWDDQIVYRYRPRENEAVNQCWMCDEGRLTYKFINDKNRVLEPLVKKHGEFQRVGWDEALAFTRKRIPREAHEVSASSCVGVVSAQASCEENTALVKFLQQVSKEPVFLTTKKEIANPSHDDFLIDADKNPNSAFLKVLGKEISYARHFPKEAVVFVLDNLTEAQKKELVDARPKLVVWLASNLWEPSHWADVVLPKPTFAEQDGTFINRQNREQKTNKAFAPRGLARPVGEVLREIRLQT